MIPTFFTRLGLFLSGFYIVWFLYERFTCFQCWGNDLFFSIPGMAIIPASLETTTLAKYLVVLINAALLFVVVYLIGKVISLIFSR